MKRITWEWRGRIMSDYFVFPWLQFSKHLDGGKHWSWTFHWKGSNAWYYNFKRRYDPNVTHVFSRTKLTLRLGTYIIIFGCIDMNKYYRDVQVLEVKDKGIVRYQYIPNQHQQEKLSQNVDKPESGKLTKEVEAELLKMKRDYEHLSRDYPDNTWRN